VNLHPGRTRARAQHDGPRTRPVTRWLKDRLLATPLGPPLRERYWSSQTWLAKQFDPITRRGERYDRQTVRVMSRVLTRSSNCIDVGCFHGKILADMVALAPAGRHYAFEPLPHLARELKPQFPSVQVFEVALSDASGEATFHHAVGAPAYSGLDRRPDRPDEHYETITVKTTRLSDLLPPDLPIHFIKIDVEGAELRVLRGARETLQAYKPFVVFELGMTSTEELYALLVTECGLQVSTLSRWLHCRPAMTLPDLHRSRRKDFMFLAYPV
jgi:FkbM family methyltransferase